LDENISVAESSAACKALLAASCGSGTELVKICHSRLTVEGAESAPLSAEKTLAPDLATFYREIGMPNAMDDSTRSRVEVFLSVLDDGTEKKSVAEAEAMEFAKMTPGLMQFLIWMGLLQEGLGNTWKVPALYRRLLR
jgi:hypothetical protein